MPAGISGNMPVNLNPAAGPGPNTVAFALCYGGPQPTNSNFVVLLNGVQITGPLTLTSTTQQAGGIPQPFFVTGDFSGIVPAGTIPTVTFQEAATNLNNISFQSVSYDFKALYTNDTFSNEGGPQINSLSAWDSNGAPTLNFGPAQAVTTQPSAPSAPEPTYTATTTTVNGATIGGAAAGALTLAALVTATPSGGKLVLPSGTIVGTTDVTVPMTIMGQGPQLMAPGQTPLAGATVISCDVAGVMLEPANDKGVFQAAIAGIVFQALTITGAVDTDNAGANAAGIRMSGPGALGVTINNCELCFNQDGFLSDASQTGLPPAVTTLNNVYIHDCGDGAAPGDTATSGIGFTHAFYAGGLPTDSVFINASYLVGGKATGHAVRCHAGHFTGDGSVFEGSLDTTGASAGSVMDFPDGGLVSLKNATIVLPGADANTIILQFGEGTAANAAVGETVDLTGAIIQNPGAAGTIIAYPGNMPNAELILTGATYTGPTPPTLTGWKTVTGAFTQGVAATPVVAAAATPA
jgi:hypothetical protein